MAPHISFLPLKAYYYFMRTTVVCTDFKNLIQSVHSENISFSELQIFLTLASDKYIAVLYVFSKMLVTLNGISENDQLLNECSKHRGSICDQNKLSSKCQCIVILLPQLKKICCFILESVVIETFCICKV